MNRIIVPAIILMILVGGAYYSLQNLPWLNAGSKKTEAPLIMDLIKGPQTYETSTTTGYMAPDFRLPTIGNKDLRLTDYLGHPVIVYFWNTKCPICANQFSVLNNFLTYYYRGAIVLAINVGDPEASIVEYIGKNQFIEQVAFASDISETVFASYEGSAIPQAFFVDKNGIMRGSFKGELTSAILNDAKKLLESPIEQ